MEISDGGVTAWGNWRRRPGLQRLVSDAALQVVGRAWHTASCVVELAQLEIC